MSTKNQKASLVWISGISGRMGSEISKALEDSKTLKLLGGHDAKASAEIKFKSADIYIDFSSIEGNQALLKQLQPLKKKIVLIGTTGLTEKHTQAWKKLATANKHLVLFAPNTSLGIYTLAKYAGKIARSLVDSHFDVELIETHHNQKKDAPSGTALLLAKVIQKECPEFKIVLGHSGLRKSKTIGVHAVRGGGVFGEHEIRFIGANEEIKIAHRAFSRALFAQGAVSLAEKLRARNDSGLIFIEDL